MTMTTETLHRLIELYVDGAIDERDRAIVERALEHDAEARLVHESLLELGLAARLSFDEAAESRGFDGLFERVMAQVDGAAAAAAPAARQARDAELELLAMQYADGELHDPRERARVERYLDEVPAARDGLDAIRELGLAARVTAEHHADAVNFALLQDRIMAAVSAEGRPAHVYDRGVKPARTGFWASLAAVFAEHRAAFTGVAAAALVAAVVLPLSLGGRSSEPAVINNYYLQAPSIESVSYDPGYYSTFRPGNDMVAPVVWIEAEDLPADANDDAPNGDDRGI